MMKMITRINMYGRSTCWTGSSLSHKFIGGFGYFESKFSCSYIDIAWFLVERVLVLKRRHDSFLTAILGCHSTDNRFRLSSTGSLFRMPVNYCD